MSECLYNRKSSQWLTSTRETRVELCAALLLLRTLRGWRAAVWFRACEKFPVHWRPLLNVDSGILSYDIVHVARVHAIARANRTHILVLLELLARFHAASDEDGPAEDTNLALGSTIFHMPQSSFGNSAIFHHFLKFGRLEGECCILATKGACHGEVLLDDTSSDGHSSHRSGRGQSVVGEAWHDPPG